LRALRRWIEDSVTYRIARRIVIALIGGTVLLIGLAMVVLPGPALVVIPAGLAILGLEFAWARRWLAKVREQANGLVDGVKNAYSRNAPGRGSLPPASHDDGGERGERHTAGGSRGSPAERS
jgi:tellurite resistance protein TerC